MATKYIRLAYQPLTRRWRINVSPEPIGNVGLGVSITQNFDSLDAALQALQRQVPRPFQIGIVGNSEWNLSATRTYRLNPDSGK